MGDGHHGWAAAEIVLFLRDCLVNDAGGSLTFLEGIPRSMLSPRASIRLRKLPTRFGPWDLEIQPVSGSESEILMRPSDNRWAKGLNAEIVLPFVVTDVSSMEPNHQPKWTVSETETRIGVSEGIRRLRIRH